MALSYIGTGCFCCRYPSVFSGGFGRLERERDGHKSQHAVVFFEHLNILLQELSVRAQAGLLDRTPGRFLPLLRATVHQGRCNNRASGAREGEGLQASRPHLISDSETTHRVQTTLMKISVPTNGMTVAPMYPASQQMETPAKLMSILRSARVSSAHHNQFGSASCSSLETRVTRRQ